MTEPSSARSGRNPAVAFVFVAVLLDMIALGITAPVLPQLIRQLLHGDAPLAARYVGWFAAIWAIMQFISSPIIGALSDRFGRRPVLACVHVRTGGRLCGDGARAQRRLAPDRTDRLGDHFIQLFDRQRLHRRHHPPEERAGRFGLLGAAFGIGFIAGPAIGGLLGQFDPRLPFWGAGILCFCNGLYGLFVVPESLKPENRSPFNFRLANPVGSFDLYRSAPGLLSLGGVMFLYYLAHQVLQSTWAPYGYFRYHWSTGMMGVSLVCVGIGSVVVQMLVVRRFVGRFGERGAIYAGLLAGATGFVIYGLAPTGPLFLAGIPIFSLMGVLTPGVQGLMTRRVPPSQQGRLQGANASLMAIASVVGPILFTETFARTITSWSAWAPLGSPFYLSAVLMALALLLAFAVRRSGEAQPQPA